MRVSLEDWRYYMYCVVLNKIKDIYILRHIKNLRLLEMRKNMLIELRKES